MMQATSIFVVINDVRTSREGANVLFLTNNYCANMGETPRLR